LKSISHHRSLLLPLTKILTTNKQSPIKKKTRWSKDLKQWYLKRRLLIYPKRRKKRKLRRRVMDPSKKHGEMDTKQRRTVRTKKCQWFGGKKKYRALRS
jgi:hypothetical protein